MENQKNVANQNGIAIQNEMTNQKGNGGSREICTSKNQILQDPGDEDEVYRIDVGEGSSDDTEYYTTCDSIVSKNGCAAGVKALRKGFELLLAVHTDSRFTGRLMKMVAEIFQRDLVKGKMKKSVLFSQHKEFLGTMVFNVRKRSSEILLDQFVFTHSESRSEATVKVEEFFLKGCSIPGSATHFRILNHVSIISDYCYSKSNRRYEPLSMLNGMCVCGYSDYLPVFGNQNIEVTVEFRDGVCPLEEDTVIQCIGIVFYQKQAGNYYAYSGGSGVMVCDVF